MHRSFRLLALGLAVICGGAALPAAAATDAGRRFTPGASGAGDPWFPAEGNGGYDVRHYDLDLSYDPRTRRLDGTRPHRGAGHPKPVPPSTWTCSNSP